VGEAFNGRVANVEGDDGLKVQIDCSRCVGWVCAE
jgi:hypothetical protein